MKRYGLLLAALLLIPFTIAFSAVYYVSPNGSDENTGTKDLSFLTIQKAQSVVNPGDTVYLRGGVYTMTESQIAQKRGIWAYVTLLDKSGEKGKPIRYWAYPGERPVFDYAQIKPANLRVFAFQVNGSWIHLKGFDVTGVQVTITTHTQSECFDNEGSHNIFEQLCMHDGQAIGFYLKHGSDNLVLNCDAYRNWDFTSEGGRGGNTDGFGCHPFQGGTGNVFRGCRAWFNSDDGYDCINSYEGVVFDHCWAFYNGFTKDFVSRGDGNGFKVGGYGANPIVAELPNPIPSNTVQFCLAYRNKANGFYANHHVYVGSRWINNTAGGNSCNFNMLSKLIVTDPQTNRLRAVDCPGISHLLRNNLSFQAGYGRDTMNLGTSDIQYNSFSPKANLKVTAEDFESLDEALLTAPRQPNGDLPVNGFLRLKPGGKLLSKGLDLGF
jgi:hypothetical protein